MEQELQKFIQRLKEERIEINKQMAFVSEHRFFKERDFLQERFKNLNTILNELEDVASGRVKSEEVKFIWG